MNRRSLVRASLWALFLSCTSDGPPAVSSAATADPTASSAMRELDGIDGRRPVPLLPAMADHQKANMRDHLLAVQEIVAALASDDYAAVERAASRIGLSDQMGQMCSHMGAGAPGFAEQALVFHRTADGIVSAARRTDRDAVLAELGATLQTCTSCHAAWRQQVVDEPTWHRLTSPPAQGEGD